MGEAAAMCVLLLLRLFFLLRRLHALIINVEGRKAAAPPISPPLAFDVCPKAKDCNVVPKVGNASAWHIQSHVEACGRNAIYWNKCAIEA